MRPDYLSLVLSICLLVLVSSCHTLEKASSHGLNSGAYKLKTVDKPTRNVYVEVTPEQIDIYHYTQAQPDKQPFLSLPLNKPDSLNSQPLMLKKHSLDIDITSILLKYRPSVYGLPAQLSSDVNLALYAGWRHDHYNIRSKKNPFGVNYPSMNNWGYDIGIFAGAGSTLISPFSTQNKRSDEYSGMIIQIGMAGFIESNLASFGLALGYDQLLNADRRIWIYQNKPWIGFIVGIALN